MNSSCLRKEAGLSRQFDLLVCGREPLCFPATLLETVRVTSPPPPLDQRLIHNSNGTYCMYPYSVVLR